MNQLLPLLVFDIDDTLTTDSSWQRLNQAAGVTDEEDLALYNAYHVGEIDYVTWTEKLADLYSLVVLSRQRQRLL